MTKLTLSASVLILISIGIYLYPSQDESIIKPKIDSLHRENAPVTNQQSKTVVPPEVAISSTPDHSDKTTVATDSVAPMRDVSEETEEVIEVPFLPVGERKFKTIDLRNKDRIDLLKFMESDRSIESAEAKQNLVVKLLKKEKEFNDFEFESASCKEHLCHFVISYNGTMYAKEARSYLIHRIGEYREGFSVSAASGFNTEDAQTRYDVFFQPRFQ